MRSRSTPTGGRWRNLIRPDDVVIDMGCGSGLLGLLALEAGAARLIAVDSGPILELARETFECNGFGDRVEYHRVHSSELTLAVPADVLVYDQVGGFAHEVGLTRNVRDLARPGRVEGGREDHPGVVRPVRGPGVGACRRRPGPALDPGVRVASISGRSIVRRRTRRSG